VSVLVAALSLDAGAIARGLLSEAEKETYKALKETTLRIVSPSDVEKLEQNSDSEGRKGVIAEELKETDKAENPELARLAQVLVPALQEAGAAEARQVSRSKKSKP
jgi:hypothetical protein